MNREIVFSILYCLITVGAFCAGKYIFPRIQANTKDKLVDLTEWAAKFVVWAREFMKTESGEEKMTAVIEQLKVIAAETGIEVTEDHLKAIVQTAYEAMKAGEAEASATYYKIGKRAVAKGSTVNVYTGTAAVEVSDENT